VLATGGDFRDAAADNTSTRYTVASMELSVKASPWIGGGRRALARAVRCNGRVAMQHQPDELCDVRDELDRLRALEVLARHGCYDEQVCRRSRLRCG
jgi:hypothetical protein